jgi:homoserine/homoserine lactone efflux protein
VATDVILWFVLTEFAMALSPGPAVLLIMSQGARHGVRGSAAGAVGIELGNSLWFLLSAVGLTALLLASATAFQVVKWVGAAYLLYLGVRLLLSKGEAPSADPGQPAPNGALVMQGFITQMGNPKAMIFFGALLPQFVDPQGDVVLQFSVFALLTIVTEYPVLLMYGWLAHRGRQLAGGASALKWFDRVAGACLIGAGARLAVFTR